jgi:asparaginyl-tRNA synthetase
VEVSGKLRKEPRASGGFELAVHSLKVVSLAEPYPIAPKDHGIDFLMQHRHLWLRSSRQWAVLRIRSTVMSAISHFFETKGFIKFDAPILTPTACEGTSTLFATDYFEEKAFLTQSGQLYGEAGAMAFGNIYVLGPTFRAEKSKTRKHLTEFWMLEPEMAYANLEDAMQLGEELVEFLVQTVLEKRSLELEILNRDFQKLKCIRAPFPRISYDEALKILKEKGVGIDWGEDLGAPHETALGEVFGKPVFLHHMPSCIKAFYFQQADTVGGIPLEEGKYALGCDLIAPDGYGEIIGGGAREEKADVLQRRIHQHGLKEEGYDWYLDLRRYGSVPHSGFGMGIERVVAWIAGVEHVRETAAFARLIHTLRP